MAIGRYSKEVHAFVRENCTKMRDEKLAKACNEALGTKFTKAKMRGFRHNHGYNNGFGKGLTPEEYWERQTKYPKEMLEFVRENAEGTGNAKLAEMVNEKFGTDFSAGDIRGFKSRRHISSGLTGHFPTGHVPCNKGKRQQEYMSAEAIERSKGTRFKKGHKRNYEMPIGTVRITEDGYKEIKVQSGTSCTGRYGKPIMGKYLTDAWWDSRMATN